MTLEATLDGQYSQIMDALFTDQYGMRSDNLQSAALLLALHGIPAEDITALTKVRAFVDQKVGGEYSNPRFRTIDELCQGYSAVPEKYLITVACMEPFAYEQDVHDKLASFGLTSTPRKSGEGNAWEIPCGAICVRAYGLYKVEDAPQRPPESSVDDDVPF